MLPTISYPKCLIFGSYNKLNENPLIEKKHLKYWLYRQQSNHFQITFFESFKFSCSQLSLNSESKMSR